MIKSDFSFPFFHNTYMTQPHRHTQSAGVVYKNMTKKNKIWLPTSAFVMEMRRMDSRHCYYLDTGNFATEQTAA